MKEKKGAPFIPNKKAHSVAINLPETQYLPVYLPPQHQTLQEPSLYTLAPIVTLGACLVFSAHAISFTETSSQSDELLVLNPTSLSPKCKCLHTHRLLN